MKRIIAKLAALSFLGCLVVACGSQGSAGGTGGTGGGGGSGGGSGGGAAQCSGGALTHCPGNVHHCVNTMVSFFRCAEYADVDASTFESLCKQGGGTWAAGCCSEADILGQCLPLNHCNGMGIGFVTMGEDVAGAKQSCSDTGGTWMDAP